MVVPTKTQKSASYVKPPPPPPGPKIKPVESKISIPETKNTISITKNYDGSRCWKTFLLFGSLLVPLSIDFLTRFPDLDFAGYVYQYELIPDYYVWLLVATIFFSVLMVSLEQNGVAKFFAVCFCLASMVIGLNGCLTILFYEYWTPEILEKPTLDSLTALVEFYKNWRGILTLTCFIPLCFLHNAMHCILRY